MNNTRLFQIDAMRGFLMLLVVMEHSSTHLFKTFDGFSTVHTYMVYVVQFMMPSFFFICGYVLYRPGIEWSGESIKCLLKGKVNSQLISPCLFFLLYLYISHISIRDGLLEYHKEGYWFTFTLFFFYFLISLYYGFVSIIRINQKIADSFLAFIGILMFCFAHIVCSYDSIKDITSFLGVFHWRYLIFMLFGYFVRKYALLTQGAKSEILCGMSIILFILLNVFYKQIDTLHWTIALLNIFILAFTGTTLVYSFFIVYAERIKQTVLGHVLGYLGQRTLCVYYVNFFLLPVQLQYCTEFLRVYPMPLLEILLSFILAAINIAVCLIIYNIVFLCPPLGEFLFGKKYFVKKFS